MIIQALKVLLVFLATTVVSVIVMSILLAGIMSFVVLAILAILWSTT